MASSAGVTFKIAKHSAEHVQNPAFWRQEHLDMVSNLEEYKQTACQRVIQASPVSPHSFRPSTHGFVLGVIQAYSYHHNLVIRPDDVWLAILIQFGFFVTANAEAFRSYFVDHEGKKELKVHQEAPSLDSADYARFANDMAYLLRENLRDAEFCDWVFPRFSTTTDTATAVASVALMATMKHYFTYKFCICCGIPQVTLAGTVEDWEDIDARVDRLQEAGYGKVCSVWASMLKKITRQFIRTSKNDVDVDFWSKICHYTSGGSGPSYLSGWITAFCVFDGEGNWQATNFSIPTWSRRDVVEEEPQVLEFPVIDTSNIPPGYVTVDVTVEHDGKEHKTLMFAGHMGYDIAHDGKGIVPKLTWAIALKPNVE